MTQDEKRIKIAEACGWKFHKVPNEFRFTSIRPDGESFDRHFGDLSHLPDYFGSLDAMHEAEKALSGDARVFYASDLQVSRGAWSQFHALHSTAAQRAECFGRTLNLWTEEGV